MKPGLLGWRMLNQWAQLVEHVPPQAPINGIDVVHRRLGTILKENAHTAALGNRLLTSRPHDIRPLIDTIQSNDTQEWLGKQLSPILKGALARQSQAIHHYLSLPQDSAALEEGGTDRSYADARDYLLHDLDKLHDYRDILQEGTPELFDFLTILYGDALRSPMLGFQNAFSRRLGQAYDDCVALLRYCSLLRESDVRLIDFSISPYERALHEIEKLFPHFEKIKVRGTTHAVAEKIRTRLIQISRIIDPAQTDELQRLLPQQPETTVHSKTATRSRIRGALLGAAGGDAWAAPFENLTAQDMTAIAVDISTFAPKGTNKPGSWTDDTIMTQTTLEAILREKAVVPQVIAAHFSRLESQLTQRGFGLAGKKSIKRLNRRRGWKHAGSHSSIGNGAAMRMLPVAIFNYRNLELLRRDVALAGQITHHNYEALSGALAVAFIVAKVLRNEFDPNRIINETIECIGEGKIANHLRIADQLIASNTSPLEALERIGTSGIVWESVAAAVYAFLTSPDSFESSMLLIARAGGDTDTIATIAGAFSGAYNGIEAIPDAWSEGVEDAAAILKRADQLFDLIHAD